MLIIVVCYLPTWRSHRFMH